MFSFPFESKIESALRFALGDKTVSIMESINELAARQGGASIAENYQLLGKRALIVFGVVVIVVQATSSTISYIIARRSEDKRIEKIVRGILEEERQKAEEEVR